MRYLVDFLENKTAKNSIIFQHLKTTEEEANLLKEITKQYFTGTTQSIVHDLLTAQFGDEKYQHIKQLPLIKNLLDQGWISIGDFVNLKLSESSIFELLNAPVTISSSFLKLLEDGEVDMELPEVKPYEDHLEYLKDQFLRVEIYQKLTLNNSLKTKLQLLESRIKQRVEATKIELAIEKVFTDFSLNPKEQVIFLALLKEEYTSDLESCREMNALVHLISVDDYEKMKNRALLEEDSKLIQEDIIDYEEMLNGFGGVSRNFFIADELLQKIMHPNKDKKAKKIKLDLLIQQQEIFELITPKTSLQDVVLTPKTRELLNSLLKQSDTKVMKLLREWGVKERRGGIDAKIILYGVAGTGKTMTAYSLAKSMKKRVLSFDCSKILSKYVGESEQNVRAIFDTFKDLASKTKSEPVLLLNEADQFLSARSIDGGGADKMHNQMQNIFLEQIENFNGVLIATTNLLESIDGAFSRRFDYKIAFEKPTHDQRVELWQKLLPKSAQYEENFNIKELANHELSGGQIKLVLKNCALRVAIKEHPIFCMEDFTHAIKREKAGVFADERSMGFGSV